MQTLLLTWTQWNRLQKLQQPNYMSYCRDERKRMYEQYVTNGTWTVPIMWTTPAPTTSLDTCNDECFLDEEEQEEEKKEDTMYTHQDHARDHLIGRLWSIEVEHETTLRDKFHLNRKAPETVGEMKKWLKEGYFTISDEAKDTDPYYNLSGCFRWGTEKPDNAGFTKAFRKMLTAKQEAEDIIHVKTDEDVRLKALKDFQSATFH